MSPEGERIIVLVQLAGAFVVGEVEAGALNETREVTTVHHPAQLIALPMPAGPGRLAMSWALLPLPSRSLAVTRLFHQPWAVPDAAMLTQYQAQLLAMRTAAAGLTLPDGGTPR